MNISTTNSTLERVVDNNNFPNCNNNISSKMTAQVQSKHAPKVHPLVRSGINIWIEFNSWFPGRERHSRCQDGTRPILAGAQKILDCRKKLSDAVYTAQMV